MPFIDIRVAVPASRELNARIARTVGDLTQRILRKDPKLTAIAITHVSPDDWFIAGQSLAEHGLSSFFLDIRVTDETNTKDEKARYVAEIFTAFEAMIGPLHGESYVHVHDARAAAYGYGGLTQEYRYQNPGRAASP